MGSLNVTTNCVVCGLTPDAPFSGFMLITLGTPGWGCGVGGGDAGAAAVGGWGEAACGVAATLSSVFPSSEGSNGNNSNTPTTHAVTMMMFFDMIHSPVSGSRRSGVPDR